MKIELAYGKNGLVVELPDAAVPTIIRKPDLPLPPDPAAVVAEAFAAPIDSLPLPKLARGRRSACILICDITRPVPNSLFLRPMIEMLLAAGMDAARITVLVATGLHRPNEGKELARLVGDPWVLDRVRVVNHFARNDADHVTLGTTARGTPVRLDRRFVEADLRIATGLVEPHFMAGYSGGRKVITPGVAHEVTIRTIHSAELMEHRGTRSCNLADNLLHEEQLAVVRLLGETHGLNTVIDEQRRLLGATFGEVLGSHQRAVELARASAEVAVERRFSTVVTSAAGDPLDTTYYQTVKGMVTPLDILEPGGTLIVASECSRGLGSAAYRSVQERLVALGPDAFFQSLTGKARADIDEWQSQMQLRPLRLGRVELFSSGLSDADHALTGVARTDDLEAAVARSLERSGDRAVAVIPEGPYVVPFYRPA